jgi:hypothetical protein
MDSGLTAGTKIHTAARALLAQVAAIVSLLGVAPPAAALPSFATQTGMPCDRCHSVGFGPALTPYGRQFKLNGYVWGDAATTMPVALMIQGGFTRTAVDQPEPPADHYSRNENASIDQTSLFLAGRLSSQIGAFAQFTYSGTERNATWDNLDVRYAKPVTLGGSGVVVGISLNNNPTVQDLWNSTPAWGFPYIQSALAPTPAASPLIGGLGQSVLGATAYAMVNDRLYLEAGGYRSLSNRWLGNVGLDADNNANIDGVAPYWRAALQFDGPVQHVSVGTFGLAADLRADPTVAATDAYRDVGIDATYQYVPPGPHQVVANAALIHERRELNASFAGGASDAVSNHLTLFNADVTYAYERTWSATLAVFDVGGSSNSVQYAPAPLSGSANGAPDSRGYTLQLEYIPFGKADSPGRPWLNVRLGLQYVGYLKFNGGTSNYDGFGRAASDNNTLFAYLWAIL